ncbi:putative Proline--tRNA ligase [Paratrimastix pyriformis]|uniref:proline--tRNA ligase n=1 Tax=Paratrimastix pyriformis TaxID=342808 RepID=A0ABQ8UBN1_9EUKA|nr:putative Proline--tRNA ligase [Paratrimastix pyriformis]
MESQQQQAAPAAEQAAPAPVAEQRKKPTAEEIEERKRQTDELRKKRAAEQRSKTAQQKPAAAAGKEESPAGTPSPAAATATAATPETFNFPKDREGFAAWYDNIMTFADIVDRRYPVKGMPILKPYGYFMHNQIMKFAEQEWESQGIQGAQFPVLIPADFLGREKEHVKGFEKECFWVTKGGENDLETKCALRPTSETAMYPMYALWIRSFRDLPLKMYQTNSVYRYETKDTRPLIRVREIPWNEGHTCHATAADALDCLEQAWGSYTRMTRDLLGFTGVRIRRAVWDKFAGSEHTDVLDTIMPCGRVLQAVGAHYLGQKFARVFDIKFLNKENAWEYAYMTCFGISTRILAAALAIHGDQKGLVLPPMLAQKQVVIVPILVGKKTSYEEVINKAKEYRDVLMRAGIRAYVDDTPSSPGEKFYYWEMKGVPLRMEVGPRDVQNGTCVVVRRDTGEKSTIQGADVAAACRAGLDALLANIRAKGLEFHRTHITTCNTVEEMVHAIQVVGGFARIPFHSMGMEAKVSDERVHELCGGEVRGFSPAEEVPAPGTLCIITGKPATVWAYVARAY